MDFSLKSSNDSYPMFFHELGWRYNSVQPLSEKAKAFSIDAIMNKEPVDKKPLNVSRKERNILVKGKDFRRELFTKNQTHVMDEISVSKQGTTDNSTVYHAIHQREMNTLYSDLHMAAQRAMFYSPLMTCGYTRPDEGFSPKSNEGHLTPAGLQSVYTQQHDERSSELNGSLFSTPDSKNGSSDESFATSQDRYEFSRLGGRKVLSTFTKRHDRPHPYLSCSPRQSFSSPSQELEFLIQDIAEAKDDGPTTKAGKSKRFRTAFTPEQLQVLEEEFDKQQYCVGEERVELAKSLNLSVSQVKVWFQNRRIKWRKEQFDQGKIN